MVPTPEVEKCSGYDMTKVPVFFKYILKRLVEARRPHWNRWVDYPTFQVGARWVNPTFQLGAPLVEPNISVRGGVSKPNISVTGAVSWDKRKFFPVLRGWVMAAQHSTIFLSMIIQCSKYSTSMSKNSSPLKTVELLTSKIEPFNFLWRKPKEVQCFSVKKLEISSEKLKRWTAQSSSGEGLQGEGLLLPSIFPAPSFVPCY